MRSTSKLDPAKFAVIYGSLKALDAKLAKDRVNKHDRAQVLINECIANGIVTGPSIVGVLVSLGFNGKHAGMMLQDGLRARPEGLNWGRSNDGNYYVPKSSSST